MPVNNAVQPEMQVPSFPSTSWQNQGWGNAYTNNWMNNNSGGKSNILCNVIKKAYPAPRLLLAT